MKQIRRKINHLPLLTTARGGAFEQAIGAARIENGHHPTKHLLYERLVFSLLAYRARIDLGASVREVARETGLHPETAKATLTNLSDLAHEHDGRWYANEPPEGWFRLANNQAKHWSEHFAYMWLLLPRKGTTFQVGDRSRRFNLNHATVFSLLVSLAAENGTVRNVTALAIAKMLNGLNRKTVSSVLDDLVHLSLIERRDLGSPLVLRLLPFKDEHYELFASPSQRSVPPEDITAPASRPTTNKYDYKDDGFDEYRRLCEGFMPQSYAERATRAAKVLGWDTIEFQLKLEDAKDESEENVRTGKCAIENFGKYFIMPLEERVNAIKEQERKEEAEERRRAYLASPEGRKAMAEQEKAAAADPLHNLHSVDAKSLTDRVRFSDNPIHNHREAERILSKVGHHCRKYVATKRLGTQEEVDTITGLRHKIMRMALAAINGYYQQEVKASPAEFEKAIDRAILETEPAMKPLFGEASEIMEVANA
jgi:hypothetical protein